MARPLRREVSVSRLSSIRPSRARSVQRCHCAPSATSGQVIWIRGAYREISQSHTRCTPCDRTCLFYSICSYTQAAARRILYEIGIREFSGPFDLAQRLWCNGHNGGERIKSCLISQPPYINLHRPVGRECDFSEISGCKSEDYNDVAVTRHVRQSVRVNLPKFVEGATDYIDSWPDYV